MFNGEFSTVRIGMQKYVEHVHVDTQLLNHPPLILSQEKNLRHIHLRDHRRRRPIQLSRYQIFQTIKKIILTATLTLSVSQIKRNSCYQSTLTKNLYLIGLYLQIDGGQI